MLSDKLICTIAELQALSVVAGYVELLAGTPRDIEEAREASGRNGFQNRQRRVVEAAPAASAAVVVEQPGALVEEQAPVAAQEQDAPAAVEEQAPPPVAEPVKPRRKEPSAVVQVVTVVEEDGEPGGAEVEPAGVEGNGNGHLVEK